MSNEVKKWNGIIEEYKVSGLSQLAFCKERALSRHQFQYRWYLYNRAIKSGNTAATGQEDNSSSISAFEPITIMTPTATKEPSNVTELVIHLPNQIRCDIKIDISSKAAITLLKQLVSLC